jgi:L-aminopeptidase/D-esterase-like protein
MHCGSYFGESLMEQAGQGAAFAKFGATKLAVFTVVVDACGVIVREGKAVLGNRDPQSGRHSLVFEDLRASKGPGTTNLAPGTLSETTALALLVTNRDLRQDEIHRPAVAADTSMARAIQPFHTERDGDAFFAVTIAKVCKDDPKLPHLCVLSPELPWNAVLNCVPTLLRDSRDSEEGEGGRT